MNIIKRIEVPVSQYPKWIYDNRIIRANNRIYFPISLQQCLTIYETTENLSSRFVRTVRKVNNTEDITYMVTELLCYCKSS